MLNMLFARDRLLRAAQQQGAAAPLSPLFIVGFALGPIDTNHDDVALSNNIRDSATTEGILCWD
jgi:hypothetical protein